MHLSSLQNFPHFSFVGCSNYSSYFLRRSSWPNHHFFPPNKEYWFKLKIQFSKINNVNFWKFTFKIIIIFQEPLSIVEVFFILNKTGRDVFFCLGLCIFSTAVPIPSRHFLRCSGRNISNQNLRSFLIFTVRKADLSAYFTSFQTSTTSAV